MRGQKRKAEPHNDTRPRYSRLIVSPYREGFNGVMNRLTVPWPDTLLYNWGGVIYDGTTIADILDEDTQSTYEENFIDLLGKATTEPIGPIFVGINARVERDKLVYQQVSTDKYDILSKGNGRIEVTCKGVHRIKTQSTFIYGDHSDQIEEKIQQGVNDEEDIEHAQVKPGLCASFKEKNYRLNYCQIDELDPLYVGTRVEVNPIVHELYPRISLPFYAYEIQWILRLNGIFSREGLPQFPVCSGIFIIKSWWFKSEGFITNPNLKNPVLVLRDEFDKKFWITFYNQILKWNKTPPFTREIWNKALDEFKIVVNASFSIADANSVASNRVIGLVVNWERDTSYEYDKWGENGRKEQEKTETPKMVYTIRTVNCYNTE